MARRRFLQSVGLSAAAVSTREPWQARAEAEAKAGQLTISLLNITDLHGHILPTQSYEGVENLGGFARCVTQIKQWRTEQPHSILLDVGDVYQGTPESRASDGQLLINLFNKLNYDAWVIGNHEFDWGFGTVVKSITASAMPVLASNARVEGKWSNQLDKTHPLTARNLLLAGGP
jgi:5'-nucleotidase